MERRFARENSKTKSKAAEVEPKSKRPWTSEEDETLRTAVCKHGGKKWKMIATFIETRAPGECNRRWNELQNHGTAIKKPWSPNEDAKMADLVRVYGPCKWAVIASYLPGRNGKQCRERWHNQLNPHINKDPWSPEEDQLVVEMQRKYGNRWAKISEKLEGRTDNAVKNHWHSSLKSREKRSTSWPTPTRARKAKTPCIASSPTKKQRVAPICPSVKETETESCNTVMLPEIPIKVEAGALSPDDVTMFPVSTSSAIRNEAPLESMSYFALPQEMIDEVESNENPHGADVNVLLHELSSDEFVMSSSISDHSADSYDPFHNDDELWMGRSGSEYSDDSGSDDGMPMRLEAVDRMTLPWEPCMSPTPSTPSSFDLTVSTPDSMITPLDCSALESACVSQSMALFHPPMYGGGGGAGMDPLVVDDANHHRTTFVAPLYLEEWLNDDHMASSMGPLLTPAPVASSPLSVMNWETMEHDPDRMEYGSSMMPQLVAPAEHLLTAEL